MKTKTKKLLAAMLAAAMTAAMLLIPVSAKTVDVSTFSKNAKTRNNGDSFSVKLSDNEVHYYKIKLTKGGDLRIDLTSACEETILYVYDESGNELSFSKSKSTITKGGTDVCYWYEDANGNDKTGLRWNKDAEQFKGKIIYGDLDKGTYYIGFRKGGRCYHSSYSGQGKAKIKLTFPGEAAEESGSAETKASPSLSVTLKAGETLPLGVADADGTVTWTSSKKSIAEVDKNGKVTAKKAGSATITAQTGKTKLEINIVVS